MRFDPSASSSSRPPLVAAQIIPPVSPAPHSAPPHHLREHPHQHPHEHAVPPHPPLTVPPPPLETLLPPPVSREDTLEYEEYDDDDYDDTPLTWRERIRDNQEVINTFVAGGLAGAASRTVVSPLERLKIILQVQSSQPGGQGQAYGGVWPSLVRMWKEEGFKGFMKGNGINVVRILPYSALQFTSYGFFKNVLRNWSGEETLSAPLRLTAGAGAGIVAVSATYPLDLVRARLSIATANMAQTGAQSAFTSEDAKLGLVGMTKKVYRTEGGLKGLYRGCWATAVGVAPYVSLNFYMYENLKAMLLPADLEMGDFEFTVRKLTCGGLAGAISLVFTHPMDVLRRKLQVAGLSALSPKYDGAIDCIVKTIKADGFWKGMYRGLVPNMIKIVPSMAVSFYTFDTVHDLLGRWENLYEDDDEDPA